MAFENFKRKVWIAGIETELERLHVFADGVDRKPENEIKQLGDTARIQNIGKPTIVEGDMYTDGRDITLSDPEEVPDGSVSVVVDHYAYFNYMVQSIDKAQGAGNVMGALNKETSEGISDAHDRFLANLVLGDTGVQMYNSGTATALTKDNVFDVLDKAQEMLFEKDVKESTKVTVFIPPWVRTLIKQGYIKVDTDNSEMIKKGVVGMYGNMILKMSNNVATKTVSNTKQWYLQMRTDRAIAFVDQITELDPYKPEKKFGDAMKGLNLYGGKIVRPKEIVTIPVKKS